MPKLREQWEAIRVRLATWNVNSVKARLPRLLEWLGEAKPDIVCLQEIKTTTALFPEAEVNELGYEVAAHGDGRWNGVALLSSVGLDDVSLGFPGQPSYAGEPSDPGGQAELTLIDEPDLRKPEARAVGATCGGIRVWSLYASLKTWYPGLEGKNTRSKRVQDHGEPARRGEAQPQKGRVNINRRPDRAHYLLR